MQKIEHNSLCETESYKGMTDEQIINCMEYKSKTGCELCDLKPDIYCQTCNIGLLKQSLDLINRQKAEITEKDETIKAQADTIFLYEQVIKDKKAEIERLKKLQKPTGTGGYKIENGKVIFYSDLWYA